MGELILCSHPIAAMPYYIDNISLNVYSLEELCYYIENHLYLIEADFMSEELCLWIGQELDEKDLAQSLRSVLLGNGSLSDFTTDLKKLRILFRRHDTPYPFCAAGYAE